MNDSVNVTETEVLLEGQSRPVPVYSGSFIQDEPSRSIAEPELLVRNTKHDSNQRGIPIFRAIFIVMNGAMGAGILNFPQAFAKAGGVQSGMIIQMIMLFFVIGSFVILAYCADKSGAQNYQEIVRDILGVKFFFLTQICVLLYMIGTGIAYMILIADQLDKVAEAISPEHHWYVDRKFLVTFVAVVFILPLCLPKHLGILSYTSTLGSLGVAYISFVAVFKYFSGTYQPAAKIQEHVKVPWTQLFNVIHSICFGYQVHVQAVPVYAELRRPTLPRFAIVCAMAMMLCCLSYSLTGCFSYLTFGQKVKGDILLNYDPNDTLANVARVVLALVVFSSYAVVCFCGRASLDGLWLSWWAMSPRDAKQHAKHRRMFITVAWVLFSLILALFVSEIDYIISIVGGLAALFIFFFPGLCLVVVVLNHHGHLTSFLWTQLIIGVVFVYIGMLLFGESEVVAIMQKP